MRSVLTPRAEMVVGDGDQGDWTWTLLTKQYTPLGETWTYRVEWVPRNAAYCFWLGKDGEARSGSTP